ncbi:hypothetical protein ACTFIU_007438 [Dictyostelium citrinum]
MASNGRSSPSSTSQSPLSPNLSQPNITVTSNSTTSGGSTTTTTTTNNGTPIQGTLSTSVINTVSAATAVAAAAVATAAAANNSGSGGQISLNGGSKSKKLVEFILLAEFDILQGSKVKYQYPYPIATGEMELMLSEYMLPDGAHKRNDDWTVFFLNRPVPEGGALTASKSPEKSKNNNNNSSSSSSPSSPNNQNNKSPQIDSKSSLEKQISPPVEAFIYSFSETDEEKGWVMLDSEKLKVEFYQTHILIGSPTSGVFSTKIEKHADLEFTQLEPLFDCVLTDSSTALGIRFLELSEEKIFLEHLTRMISEVQAEQQNGSNKSESPETSPTTTNPSTTTEENTNIDPNTNISSNNTPTENLQTTNNTTTTTTTTEGENNTTTTTTTTTTKDSKDSKDSSTSDIPEEQKCKDFLYCLSFMNNQKDDTVKRGAVVKSMAICTTHPFISIFKPFIVLAMQKYFSNPSLDVIVELYNSLNSLDMTTVPQLNDIQKHILRSSPDRNKHIHATTITYLGNKMPLYIPITYFPDEVGDYKVIGLVQKFGNDVMKIFNGVLSQKRIIFLGYGCGADEICNYVLAACSMVCPPLKGTRERCFPNINLHHQILIDKLPPSTGVILGVSNPVFEERSEWWDILCNIGTGKVILNPSLVTEIPDKFQQYDNDFMAEVNYNISAHYGEDKIKSLFQEYTQHIVDMALDEEEFLDDQQRQLAIDANHQRIEAWTKTKTFSTYLFDKENTKRTSAIRDHTILSSIRKLRKKKHIPEKEVLKIYHSFLNSIKTEEQVTEFLSYLPKSHGGLFPVAVGLFHKSDQVRYATCQLLRILDKFQSGNAFISGLNPFLKTSYERTLRIQELLQSK